MAKVDTYPLAAALGGQETVVGIQDDDVVQILVSDLLAAALNTAQFTADGAHAVAMPAISKMRQHYSLYDVIGGKELFNPATDYSGALQAAVDDLPASGGRIEVPTQPCLINARPWPSTRTASAWSASREAATKPTVPNSIRRPTRHQR